MTSLPKASYRREDPQNGALRPRAAGPPGPSSDWPVPHLALASRLALFTGAAMVLAGFGKLGFIADLPSKPTMLGYMNGLALTIMVGRLPKLLAQPRRGPG